MFRYADSGSWTRYFSALIHKGPIEFLLEAASIFKNCVYQKRPSTWLLNCSNVFKEELLRFDEDLYRRIIIIRGVIEDRVKQLAKVNKVVSRLRYVFLVVDGVDRGPDAIAITPKSSSSTGQTLWGESQNQLEALQAFSRREVRTSLEEFTAILLHVIASPSSQVHHIREPLELKDLMGRTSNLFNSLESKVRMLLLNSDF